MPVTCARCSKTIEFSGERPRFCAFCGSPLEATGSEAVNATSPFTGPADETREYVAPAKKREEETWPDRVASYDLVRLLGRGGMGAVFEAQEEGTGRRVALKLIAHDRVASPESLERFRQEGRLASTVSHPRCVFVLAADEADGRPYIVMELMPGTTLQDLVERDGPMGVEQAVPRMIDVIDGLVEAHGLGVIHRDVKPSNCFLDDDGRTKIGDFGLSKSLGGGSHLTRTGAFLGTPLYASPEQIKGEPIDERTDVYSVAATLYYLLAGKPPFEGTDAAATLARIVSEPLVPLRSIRPEVPIELESIVQRGMAREKARRFRNLAELRAALESFAPGRLVPAPPGRRVAAFVLDVYPPSILVFALLTALFFLATRGRRGPSETLLDRADSVTMLLVVLVSFALIESFTGASPGKWLMGLRVWGRETLPATFRAIWVRSAIFFGVACLPNSLWTFLTPGRWKGDVLDVAVGLASNLLPLVLFVPTRRSEGYLGWHERLSGTRVVRLPRSARRRAPLRRRPVGKGHHQAARPVGVLRAIGPYQVRGAVKWEERRRVLAAEDPTLGRECWVVLRARGGEPPSAASRELARDTRPRWLGGGEQGEHRWDAYTAPGGCTLADLAGANGLGWAETRPLLEDLAEELSESVADGTLPPNLSVDMVWVEPDGTSLLVDALADPGGSDPSPSAERALELLHRAAALALQGGQARPGDQGRPIRAAVPVHAREALDRLLGGPNAYRGPAEFRDALAQNIDEVSEVDRPARGLQLALQAVLIAPMLMLLYGAAFFLVARSYADYGALFEQSLIDEGYASVDQWAGESAKVLGVTVIAQLLAWVAWGAFTRGGLSLRMTGLALVRRDGQRPSRFRCGTRSFIAWAPIAALLGLTSWTLAAWPQTPALSWVALVGSALLLLAYPALALIRPERGLHDRLAGTVIVPR